MASPQAEAIKAQMKEAAAAALGEELTLEERRDQSVQFGELTAEPEGVTYTETEVAGCRAIWADPPGGAADRVIEYFHGGGYVLGSIDFHKKFTGQLAKEVGCRVLNFDYRLAPEHPHPAAVNDSTAAYHWLLAEGYEPSQMAIAGDSAGGGLAAATLLKLRDDGAPMPAAGVPISPWVDMEGLGDSLKTKADVDVIVDEEIIKELADMFLAGQDARDPLAAPLYGDYTGVSPMYIQVGEDETLLDDSTRLAAKAKADGCDVTLEVFPEMQHVFQMCAGNMPEADEALAKIGAWLRPRLGL